MNKNFWAIWSFTIFTILPLPALSSGLFELQLKKFTNENGKDNLGVCCSGLSDTNEKCIGSCNTKFRACLLHYQAQIDVTSKCTFGDVVTPVLGQNNVDLTTQTAQQLDFMNPIQFPFNFTWPGTFTLIIEAWHKSNEATSRSHEVLISRSSIQRVLAVSSEWTEEQNESTQSTVQYAFRVTCDENYYGVGCSNYCRPRDDRFGHFTCSATGERTCLSGWEGDYCLKPRCLPGCDKKHGHCTNPNECICHLGWKGALCDECETHPGCLHGTCEIPWKCNCNEGWGGSLCNQDLNFCTNHRPCQHNGTCYNTGEGSYTCQCLPGYRGTDCEIVISDCEYAPCLHNGACFEEDSNRSYRCECRKGYTGRHCEFKTLTCADKPCLHGTCKDVKAGFECQCPNGYSGTVCEHQIDECTPNPCENGGSCTSGDGTFKCTCPSGFTGKRCEENIDDCQGNPCLNGGTCVDMINQFRCRCVPGYIGSNCADKVDLCLTKPCANGGSCINLNNDYRCICRPGFTAKDCSIDIDECLSRPCKNGGTCVNRVNSFQCVCPGGFRGVECEDEAYSDNYDATLISTTHHEAHSGRSEGLSNVQIAVIIISSIFVPLSTVIAAACVLCIKNRRKNAKEKDDAEARKQNEQNASATLHHGNSILSSKRSSSTGLTFDSTNPMIINNKWEKGINNMSNSASVDDCFLNTSIYGTSNYSDTTSDCCINQQIAPLQRARSQKQLNTDPSVMHRASKILPKEYLFDNKRISVMGSSNGVGTTINGSVISGDSSFCSSQRWSSTQRDCGLYSPHM